SVLFNQVRKSRAVKVALSIVTVAAFVAAIIPADDPTKIYDDGGKGKTAVPPPHTEWKDYGGGPDHSKFMNFTQINKQNVTQLEPAFVYSTAAERGGSYKFNPIIVD